MADVKWIKLSVDIFDNRKIKQIRKLPDGANICIMWFQLMCLAGRINDHGQIYITEEVPFTDETLATEFDLPIQTVQLGLQAFQKFGMIEIVGDILRLSSWERYQSVDKLDKYREYQRNYHREYREKQKALQAPENENVNLRKCLRKYDVNATDKEEDKKIDKKIDKKTSEEERSEEVGQNNLLYDSVKDLFNTYCKSFSPVRSLSATRKEKLDKLFENYSVEDFSEAFRIVESNEFLKGANERGWKADFDWLIEEENFVKVLENRYRKYESTSAKKTEDLKDDDYEKEVERFINGQ